MVFLDFYKLDLMHLIIIAFSSFVFYMLLNKLDKEEKYKKTCFGISCKTGNVHRGYKMYNGRMLDCKSRN